MVLNIEIPEGVKPPKFRLFEKVSYRGKDQVVTGMTWFGPWSPCGPGWQYDLDEMFGLWKIAGYPNLEDGEMVPEDELRSVVITKGSKTDG